MNSHSTPFVAYANGDLPDLSTPDPQQDDPLIKGFAVSYDRKFNLGNFESLNPAVTIWVRRTVPEDVPFDLHDARRRVREMARQNVRAQLLRLQGMSEPVSLSLPQPNPAGDAPFLVRTVSLSLSYRVNLGDYNSITPAYTDWADLRHLAHSPTELHQALGRMWHSLWVNVEDEIARARGLGGQPDPFFGLPPLGGTPLGGGTSLEGTPAERFSPAPNGQSAR